MASDPRQHETFNLVCEEPQGCEESAEELRRTREEKRKKEKSVTRTPEEQQVLILRYGTIQAMNFTATLLEQSKQLVFRTKQNHRVLHRHTHTHDQMKVCKWQVHGTKDRVVAQTYCTAAQMTDKAPYTREREREGEGERERDREGERERERWEKESEYF